jgi:hypothetical protein
MVLSNTKFRILFTIPIVVLLFSIYHAPNSPLIVGFHHHCQPHALHESHRLFCLMTLNIGTQEQEVPFETMKCIPPCMEKHNHTIGVLSYQLVKNICGFVACVMARFAYTTIISQLCCGSHFNPKNFDSFFHILYLFHITHVLLLACKVEPQQCRCFKELFIEHQFVIRSLLGGLGV